MENYMICNCKSVSYFDVEDALHQAKSLSDLEKTFEELLESCPELAGSI